MGSCNSSKIVTADGGAGDQRMQSDATDGATGEEGNVAGDEGEERMGDCWDKQYFVRRAVGRGSVVRVRRSTKQQENEWQLQWQQEARRRGLFSTTGIYDAVQWQQPLVRGQKVGAGEKSRMVQLKAGLRFGRSQRMGPRGRGKQ